MGKHLGQCKGVLWVKGPNVGRGYTEASRNEGTFTQDGWLITGDMGHVDLAGRVFVTGRQKDLIIRSSHNIDPRVIEDALQRHPDVAMAAAVGEPDEYAGEIPVAYVTVRPGSSVSPEALCEFAQQLIPERPAFAKRVEILPVLPMTAIDKVYKPALKALAAQYALTERLARIGLDRQVLVSVQESGATLTVVFTVRVSNGEPKISQVVESYLRQLIGHFALNYRIEARTLNQLGSSG